MTELSAAANTDWDVLSDVKDALAAATIKAQPVFAEVTLTTSEAQIKECQHKGATPRCIILYKTTPGYTCIEGEYGETVEAALYIETKVDRGVDESDAIKEVLRLKNAAMNAIETTQPSSVDAMGNELGEFHEAIEWGRPVLDTAARLPWAGCVLPVTFSYLLASRTSH